MSPERIKRTAEILRETLQELRAEQNAVREERLALIAELEALAGPRREDWDTANAQLQRGKKMLR